MKKKIKVMTYDDLRCPLCGAVVKWSLRHTRGNVASIVCQNGVRVSRRMSPDGTPDPTTPPCRWIGGKATVVRNGRKRTLFVMHQPIPLDEFPETEDIDLRSCGR